MKEVPAAQRFLLFRPMAHRVPRRNPLSVLMFGLMGTGRMIFRHDADLQESDFGLAGHMSVSAGFFPMLYDRFSVACEQTLAE
jgi:hypothetical protein